jgi:hypothetical protein
MELKDQMVIAISGLALLVSLWAARRSWRSNLAGLRRTARNGYTTALLDIDRLVITNPKLWAVYEPTVALDDASLDTVRRKAFIWYHLNLFETVYYDFHHLNLEPMDLPDRQTWAAWEQFIRSFVIGSPEVRQVLRERKSMALLNQPFVDYIERVLSDLDPRITRPHPSEP